MNVPEYGSVVQLEQHNHLSALHAYKVYIFTVVFQCLTIPFAGGVVVAIVFPITFTTLASISFIIIFGRDVLILLGFVKKRRRTDNWSKETPQTFELWWDYIDPPPLITSTPVILSQHYQWTILCYHMNSFFPPRHLQNTIIQYDINTYLIYRPTLSNYYLIQS